MKCLQRAVPLSSPASDTYGRGRIIGDYRRVALYGTEILIAEKKHYLKRLDIQELTEEIIQSREEISEQIKALKAFEKMCRLWFRRDQACKGCTRSGSVCLSVIWLR